MSSGARPPIVRPASAIDAGVRREHAGDQVERRGLAGAVGADQRVQGAVLDGEVDALDGLDAAEALDQARCAIRTGPLGVWRGFRKAGSGSSPTLAARHRRRLDCRLRNGAQHALADADEARRREHDEADEQQAEVEQPIRR